MSKHPDFPVKVLRYLDGIHFEDHFSSSGSREEKYHFRERSDRGRDMRS